MARLAQEGGVQRFIHISGIGSDAASVSAYIRSRGEGEKGCPRGFFPAATIIRPSVMFGHGDAFVGPVAKMLRPLPVFPLFGDGQTRLQPAYVEDVAEAIAKAVQNSHCEICYELGGPRIYAYRSLLEVIARSLGKKTLLVPVPFGLWRMFALVAEMFSQAPITRNQVDLMQMDNVASPDAPGFADLEISPRSLEDALPAMMELPDGQSQTPPA